MEYSPFNQGDDPQNLLIAEDRPEIQILMKKLMEMWGHTADIVGNGLEAVEHARERSYDLCLMDRHMPVMDGIRAVKEIRESTPYFPIIMYSLEDPPSEPLLLSMGIDEWIDKNTGPGYLRERINEWGGIRTYSVVKEGDHFVIKKEMPMNKEEVQELKELKKKGLTKLKLVGADATFIVHKNIQNKISHDIIGEGKEMSEFIDRSEKEPGRCHLYKVNLHVTKDIFTPEELEEAIREENEIAVKFKQAVDKKIEE